MNSGRRLRVNKSYFGSAGLGMVKLGRAQQGKVY